MLESEVDRYKVIDTDTHVIEPYDLWTSRLDVEQVGRQGPPRAVRTSSYQEDAWYFGEKRVGAAAAAAQAGWSQYPPQHPPRLDDVDPATWEATARLNLMDKYGIWAAVLYPNVAGFGAGKMLTIGDGELMLACVQAYNDFLAEYSSVAPDRFVPIMALPFWDLDETEKEIDRAAGLGHKGVIMTGEPFFWGMPKLADPHWDRLWAMCQDAGLSVNFHIGSGDMSIFERAYEGAGEHANYAGFGVQFGIGNVSVIANLITGGVCHRFPEPQVRVRRERRRLAAVRPRAPRLAVAELRRAPGAPGVRPAAVASTSSARCTAASGSRPTASRRPSTRWARTASCTRATSRTRRAWRPARRRSPSSPASTSPRSSATCPRTILQAVLHDNAAKLYHLD